MVPDSHPSSPITVSVVSHGHDAWLPPLLDDLARAPAGLLHRVVVTHNLPAAPLHVEGLPFELLQIHNPSPLGFGANHNQAFAHADTPFFAVLNPDMRLRDPGLWPQMLSAARQPGIGAVTATLLNPDGSVQDNQRALVTPWSLFRRRVLRQLKRRGITVLVKGIQPEHLRLATRVGVIAALMYAPSLVLACSAKAGFIS